MHDEQKIELAPPSYEASHTIQMPPPPYMSDGPSPPPLSFMEAHYGESFQGAVPRQPQEERTSYMTSWKAVLREGRWTFFGCCSCILLILLIVVIVISLAPGLRKIHHRH